MAFDIDRFLSLSCAVKTDDLDWAAIREEGVDDDVAHALRYMADVESHTMLYLREVLSGQLAGDYDVLAFLACWVYEETHHGRAIDRFLAACGRPPPPQRFAEVARNTTRREKLVGFIARAAAELTPIFVATHMTWGAIQEMIAATAYTQLAHYTRNRELTRLLLRVARDERRHQRFYYEQAARRLSASPAAQRLCRLAMFRFWIPVGHDVGGDRDHGLGFIATLLHDNTWSRREFARIDEVIARLPGLHGFDRASRLISTSIAAFRRRDPARADAMAARGRERAARLAPDAPGHAGP